MTKAPSPKTASKTVAKTAASPKQAKIAPKLTAKRAAQQTTVAKNTATHDKAPSATPQRDGDKPLYWLFKSEPDKWSWNMQKARGADGEQWDGVRNYQARNNMQAMRIGDLGFFYHSNDGKEVVGIVRVCREAEQDTTTDDERWQCVKLEAVCDVKRPVTLADVKATKSLANMALVTSMRLSVQPVTPTEWTIVCNMAGLDPDKLI